MDEATEAIRLRLQFEADQAEKQAKRMERQLTTLESRFDPLARATKRHEAGLRLLEKAYETGKIDVERYQKGLANLNREYEVVSQKAATAGSAVTSMTAPASTLTGIMDRNRSVFQQVGYQVGDFAVQVQGGTSAITAFTQQGSQMLGVFGAYGAIAGAALAVTAPLVSSFMSGGAEAEEYADVLDRLKEATNAYADAAELADLSTEKLAERFQTTTSAAEALRPTFQLLADLQQELALNELGAAAEAFAEEFGGLFASVDSAGRTGRNAVLRMADDFQLTKQQALTLRDAIDAIAAAEGPQDVANAARDLNALLLETYGTATDLPDAFQEMARAAANVDVSASELQATIEDTVTSVSDIVAEVYAIDFSRAIAGAQSLQGVLQQAWATAAAMAQERVAYAESVGRGRGGDPRQFGDPSLQGDQFGLRAQLRAAEAFGSGPQVSSVGRARQGGGHGKSESEREEKRQYNELIRERDRILEGLKTTQDRHNEAVAQANRLLEAGVLSSEAYSAHMQQLQQDLIDADWKNSGFADVADDLASAIAPANSLSDALDNVRGAIAGALRQLATQSFSTGFSMLGQSILGGLGFGGLFADGAAFSAGRVIPFAKGGVVSGPMTFPMSNATGLMGEAGPEAIMPLARGADGKLGVKASGGGSGGPVYHIDARGAQEGVADQILAALRAYDQRMPERINQVIDDPRRGY